jgi:nucleoside 2-deoxyribosyltransferase
MKIYLSGSMSSRYFDRNKANFERYKAILEEQRHEVIDPHDIGGEGGSWHTAMRKDIAAMCECDAVAVIPDYADTDRGVIYEINMAIHLGLPVISADSPWFKGYSPPVI